jgi:hypothetical protein
LLIPIGFALIACQLHRPTTTPSRTLEPQVLEPQLAEQPETVAKTPNAFSIRLLSAESRGNIGRRVLHRQPDGELIEDPVSDTDSLPLTTCLWIQVPRQEICCECRNVSNLDKPQLWT